MSGERPYYPPFQYGRSRLHGAADTRITNPRLAVTQAAGRITFTVNYTARLSDSELAGSGTFADRFSPRQRAGQSGTT